MSQRAVFAATRTSRCPPG